MVTHSARTNEIQFERHNLATFSSFFFNTFTALVVKISIFNFGFSTFVCLRQLITEHCEKFPECQSVRLTHLREQARRTEQ